MTAILDHAANILTASQPSKFDINLVCDQIFQNGFSHISELFPQELLVCLHKEIEQLDKNYKLQLAGIGRGDDHTIHKTIRSDKIKWIDGETLAQVQLQERLEQLRLEINKRLMLGLFDSESNFAVYRDGDFYKRHFDSFLGDKNRILSMVIYLNPEWELSNGGLLKVYTDDNSVDPFAEIMPVWGNVVMFLSEKIPHEVTPAKRTRYSIATWFRCNNLNPLV